MGPITLVQVSLATGVATYLLLWSSILLGGAYWRREVDDAVEDLGEVEELDTFHVLKWKPFVWYRTGDRRKIHGLFLLMSSVVAIVMFISLTVDSPLVFFIDIIVIPTAYAHYVLSLPPKA